MQSRVALRVIFRIDDGFTVEGPNRELYTYRRSMIRHRCGRDDPPEPGDVLYVLAATANRDVSVTTASCSCIHFLWNLAEPRPPSASRGIA